MKITRSSLAVRYAATQEESRYALHDIVIATKDGATNLQATDGRVLARVELPPNETAPTDSRLAIRSQEAEAIDLLMSGKKAECIGCGEPEVIDCDNCDYGRTIPDRDSDLSGATLVLADTGWAVELREPGAFPNTDMIWEQNSGNKPLSRTMLSSRILRQLADIADAFFSHGPEAGLIISTCGPTDPVILTAKNYQGEKLSIAAMPMKMDED